MSSELQYIADIPAYIFGEESMLCSRGANCNLGATLEGASGALPLWFVILVIVLGAIYLAWFNYWSIRGENHSSLFRFLGYHHGDYAAKLEELTPSFSSYSYSGALLGFTIIWVMMIATMALHRGGNFALMISLLAGVYLVYVFQIIIIKLIGVVVDCQPFTKVLSRVKVIFYTILAITVSPTVLCYSLSGGNTQKVFFYIVAIQSLVIVRVFIYETFLLFLSKKVSVLHTILYLCAVELLPITLMWGFFGR